MRRDRKLLAKVLAAALFTFSMILPSLAEDIEWVDVGSMFVQMHADNRCPKACGERKWSGNWKTVTSPVTSLCECIGKKPPPKPERAPRPGAHFVEGGFITWDGAADCSSGIDGRFPLAEARQGKAGALSGPGRQHQR